MNLFAEKFLVQLYIPYHDGPPTHTVFGVFGELLLGGGLFSWLDSKFEYQAGMMWPLIA